MYEDIKSLKELLDSGVVSQKEYDTKKAEILGLKTVEDKEILEEIESAKIEHQRKLAEEKLERKAKFKKKIPLVAIVVIALLGLGIAYSFGYLGGQPQDDRLEKEHTAQLIQNTKTNLSSFTGAIGNEVTTDSSGKKTIELSSEVWHSRSSVVLMGVEGEISFTAEGGRCNGFKWISKDKFNREDTLDFRCLLDSYFGEEAKFTQEENEYKDCWDQKSIWFDEEANCDVVMEYANSEKTNEKIALAWTSE